MNILSLFDGMSCGQIALHRAGIKIDNYFASEIDKHAIKICLKNYPNTRQVGSCEFVSKNTFGNYNIDLLIGGSPCQSFSSMGNGTGLKGKSGLFIEYLRILREVKPKYFLLENVNMKQEWQDIISSYLGVNPIAINSNLLSAQNRDRLYWTNIPNIELPKDKGIMFKDILEDLPYRELKPFMTNYWGDKQRIDKGCNWVKNKKSVCLTTKNCHSMQYLLNEDKTKMRLLTVHEYEKLQTADLDYTESVPNTERFKMLGNGWTVDVIAHILSYLPNEYKCDTNEKTTK